MLHQNYYFRVLFLGYNICREIIKPNISIEKNVDNNSNLNMVPKKRNRYKKGINRKKEKGKKRKELNREGEYENFMNLYLSSDFFSSSSPHLIINCQFYKIAENSII